MTTTSTQIDFSPIESNILGLKTGRCNSDYFDHQDLYSQIVTNSYDLCRLKVPAEDEMASFRLHQTGLPYFFSGSIRKYKTRISTPPTGTYNFNDLVFEMYDGSQDKLLKDMLIGTWGAYPIGYYRTPCLSTLVDKEKEIECVFQYYKKFNLNKDYPDNKIMFIRHGDLYVGFFALNIVNNNLESHIGGILEPSRKGGYFLDMLRYIKEYCLERKLIHFIFGARNENSEVQRIFQFVGFQATGSDNVFHVPSLLSYSTIEAVKKGIVLASDHIKDMYCQCHNEMASIAENLLPHYTNTSFQLNNFNPVKEGQKIDLRFSAPVVNERELLVVLKCEGKNSPITGYFNAYKY